MAATKKSAQARLKRAAQLEKYIGTLPSPENTKETHVSESPAQFVNRRMAEIDKQGKSAK